MVISVLRTLKVRLQSKQKMRFRIKDRKKQKYGCYIGAHVSKDSDEIRNILLRHLLKLAAMILPPFMIM